MATLTEKKKSAITASAAELFLDRGYGSVSMDEIAAHACVSKRTVYNHFPSKELLFSEIVKSTWSDSDLPNLRFQAGADIRKDITEFAHSFIKMLRSERFTKLIRLVMGESERFPELKTVYSDQGIKSLIQTMTDYLSETGRVDDDPRLAAQFYLGMVKEALFWPVMLGIMPLPSAERDREVIEKAADKFIGMYGL